MYYLGIDLGTTNSVVARSYVDVNDNLITEVLNIGQFFEDNWEEERELPSAVYFATDGLITVGKEAKRQHLQDRERVVVNAKRHMGTDKTWEFDGVTYRAKDISALILKHCKNEIDKTKISYEKVVITVPASFTESPWCDTEAAAIQAGFKKDQIVIKHEPTAALLSYIDEQSKRQAQDREADFSSKKRVLVFDLGGGTCDTSIIDVVIDKDGMQFDEIGIGRYKELGGIDFDSRLADKLLKKYFEDHKLLEGELSEKQKSQMYRQLLLAAETIKERISTQINRRLSVDPQCDIESIAGKYNITNFFNNERYPLVLTKSEYDEYTKEFYIDRPARSRKHEEADQDKNVIAIIRETLEKYRIAKDSIDYVFLTGGMTKFPTVQEKIGEYFGKPVLKPADPMTAVARGAAVYEYYKPRDDKKVGLKDRMRLPESIMLNVSEGLPRVIIERDTEFPAEGELCGVFKTTSPSGVILNVYSGENEYDSSMRIQHSLRKKFRSPVMPGTPFDIKYTISENQSIRITLVIDDDMNERQELELSLYDDENITEQQYNLVTE